MRNPYLDYMGLGDSQKADQPAPAVSNLPSTFPIGRENPFDHYFDNVQAQPASLPVAQPASLPLPLPPQGGSSGTQRVIGDLGATFLKGAISLPEAAVGLADIPTGGRVGKYLEELGFRPEEAKQAIQSWYTPEQQQAFHNVEQADGFMPTLEAAYQNPSVIPHTIGESLPLMVGGQGIAKGLMTMLPKLSPLAAGAAGEGIVTAGSQAEQTRQQTKDGLLTPKQALLAAGTGVLTGAITGGAGKLANKFGVGDINQAFLPGGNAVPPPQGVLSKALNKNFVTRGIGGGAAEFGQEALQSAQEQAGQNIALDKPLGEGVGQAAAMGGIAGAGMGGTFSAFQKPEVQQPNAQPAAQQQPAQPGPTAQQPTQPTAPPPGTPPNDDTTTPGSNQPAPDYTTQPPTHITDDGVPVWAVNGAFYDSAYDIVNPNAVKPIDEITQETTNVEETSQPNQPIGTGRGQATGNDSQQGRANFGIDQETDAANLGGTGIDGTNGFPDREGGVGDEGGRQQPGGFPDGLPQRQRGGAGQDLSDTAGNEKLATNEITQEGQNVQRSTAEAAPQEETPGRTPGTAETQPSGPATDGVQDAIAAGTGIQAGEGQPGRNGQELPLTQETDVQATTDLSQGNQGQDSYPSGQSVPVQGKNEPAQDGNNVAADAQKSTPASEALPGVAAENEVTQSELKQKYANYIKDWQGFGGITPLSIDEFKQKVNNGEFLIPIKASPEEAIQVSRETRTPEHNQTVQDMKDQLKFAAQSKARGIFTDKHKGLPFAQSLINNDFEKAADDIRRGYIEKDKAAQIFDDAKKSGLLNEITEKKLSDILQKQESSSVAADKVEVGSGPGRVIASPTTETTQERRARKKTQDMTLEEAHAALLTDDMTPLSNRRAYEEIDKPSAHEASADLDDFKSVNSVHGHTGGDNVIRAVGQILHEEAQKRGVQGFRIGGDEFRARHDDPAILHEIFTATRDRAAKEIVLKSTRQDGSIDILNGIGLSYGVGTSFEHADKELENDKANRKAAGLRQGTRDAAPQPKGMAGKTATGQQAGSDTQKTPSEPVTPEAQPDSVKSETESVKAEAPKLVTYTTKKGKKLDGYVRQDLTLAQAKEVDPYTFKHQGGYFIRAKYLDVLNKKLGGKIPPNFVPQGIGEISPKDQEQFANNKIFTADKVAAARERLKAKLGTLNSGFDPELALDGLTIAGAYIESGVKGFAEYSKAMVEDLGDKIKPYLLSFYEGARAYPGLNTEGMTGQALARALHKDMLTPAVLEQAKEAVGVVHKESPKEFIKSHFEIVHVTGNKPAAKPAPKTGQERTLKADWGVGHIDDWTEIAGGKNIPGENGFTGGLKDAFLDDTKKYLDQVATQLQAQGFSPYNDPKGKPLKPVSVNKSGPATSGDVSLTLRNGEFGVYVTIGDSSMRGIGGFNHPQGVVIMLRHGFNRDGGDKYLAGAQNHWLPANKSSTEIARLLLDWAADFAQRPKATTQPDLVQTKGNYVKTEPDLTNKELDNGTLQRETVPDSDQKPDNAEQPGGANGGQVDAGVAEKGKRTDPDKPVQGSLFEPTGTREGGTGTDADAGVQPPEQLGEDGSVGLAPVATLDDHEITEDLGKGGKETKFKDNIAAIKLIKQLEDENRTATLEERKVLEKYVGFGALKNVFNTKDKHYQELKDLLTEEEYTSARASILNAHYTSRDVVSALYQALGQFGFAGGRILEPSVGSGNFIGMMPKNIRNASKIHGVELDNLTSRLVRQLYPGAVISASTDFSDYKVPSGFFDVALGNPPFGNEKLVDSDRSPYSGFSIHNYFLAKMLDKTRDGGLMVAVVSHNFMDVISPAARDYIARNANFLGAIRLPNTAFKQNAGTEVVTDLVFFQKTSQPNDEALNKAWLESSDIFLEHPETREATRVRVNNYFINNPGMVLGQPSLAGSMYRDGEYTVEATGDLKTQLAEAVKSLPQNLYQATGQPIIELTSADVVVPAGIKEGSYFIEGGKVYRRLPDVAGEKQTLAWEPANNAVDGRMRGMINLRNLLRQQLRLELSRTATEKQIEGHRQTLAKDYKEFVKEYGFLNSQINRRVFIEDTESELVQALEADYDAGVSKAVALKNDLEERKPGVKEADILSRRVAFPPLDNVIVNNAKDALLESLNTQGRLDIVHMISVYGKPEAEIIKELGDLVYQDPDSGWQMADDYLSGDVKTKLADAKTAAEADPAFQRNVDALEKVIPKDKLPSEIHAPIGAMWVPEKVYQDFVTEITGATSSSIKYSPLTATWGASLSTSGNTAKMTVDYGTDKLNSFEIFQRLLSGKPVEVKKRVYDPVTKSDKLVTDEAATESAKAAADKVKQLWQGWIWQDGERSNELAGIFNDKYNRTVNRKYDGSHLNFPGSNPNIQLRKHQKDGVWRGIQERNMLLDHVVGAGKTIIMAATAREFKRLGIAKKPLFVVPNHLIRQWRAEFTKLYPTANVLAADQSDFAKDNRKRLFAKITTGDYDAVIIGHSSIKKVQLSPEIESKFYDQQIIEISSAIEDIKRERGDHNIIRDMEKIKANLQAKLKDLKNLAGTRDDVVYFDELGVDALFIDELHEFKNLFFTTQKQRISGLGNPAGSGKAFDLFSKVRWFQDTFGERAPLVTATGTPVSNSLAEMFTMQRYMRYQELRRENLHLFDAWANLFGEDEYLYEVAPSGVGYRISQRFSKFKNLGYLMGHYQSFADIATLQDLKDQSAEQGKRFPVPNIEGGRPQNVVSGRSELQTKFYGVPKLKRNEDGSPQFVIEDPDKAEITKTENDKWLLKAEGYNKTYDTEEDARLDLITQALTPVTTIDPKSILGQFENLRTLTRESKGKINALSLTNLANKASLDFRLIDPNAPDFPGSKINKAVDKMVDIYHQWTKDKGAQLVFADLSVPLSAKSKAETRERRVYVKDNADNLTHKKGTLHTLDGFEGFPFYLVKNDKTKLVDLYEPITGMLMKSGLGDRKAAKDYVKSILDDDAKRDRWYQLREDNAPIQLDQIAEYRDNKNLEASEDGENEYTPDSIESLASGSSQFSVYDDIKAKLLAKGVPEREIAFIHDYDTPAKKDELFKRVRRGDVRFLMGSTPKMGAGTNVQERLVGLHHIDAPWRPSDLEQREGRIIRQDNKLFERDPDGFQVFIGRYATEQTYDTRRWQLLEHKAAGIEQLRKYSGEAELEDVGGEAANAADMKAAASGNPLILEETTLRNEVKKLSLLQLGHADQIHALHFKVKDLKWQNANHWPKTIEDYGRVLADSKPYPLPQDPKLVASLKVAGKAVKTREEAIAALTALVEDVGNPLTRGMKSIDYRGVLFTLKNTGLIVELDAPTGRMDVFGESDKISPSGLLTRFNNYIESASARIEHAKAKIETNKGEIVELEAAGKNEFPQKQALQDTIAQHAVVQRKLMKSTQLDAVPANERDWLKGVLEKRKEQFKKSGYGDVIVEIQGLDNAETEQDTDKFSIAEKPGESATPVSTIRALLSPKQQKAVDSGRIKIVQSYPRPGVRGFFDGKGVTLVADNLNADTLQGVLAHELFHQAVNHNPLLKERHEQLIRQFKTAFNSAALGKGSKAERDAYDRVINAKTPVKDQAEEFAAYLIEAYSKNPKSFSERALKAIRDFIAHTRVALMKLGFTPRQFTIADLAVIAHQSMSSSQADSAILNPATVKASIKDAGASALTPSIIEAKAALDWVDNGDPVAKMKGDEVPRFKATKDLVNWISKNWGERTGHSVARADIGAIRIDKVAVRTSAGHGLNTNKVQAFYLVPEVIQNGKILGTLPEQPGKPIALLIAAPVKIGNKNFKMYIEVRKDANIERMYVHEVVLNDPSEAFKILAASQKGAEPQSASRGAIYNFIRDLRNVKPEENPGSDGSGKDAPSLTRSESTLTRNEAGAGRDQIAQQSESSSLRNSQIENTFNETSYDHVVRFDEDGEIPDFSKPHGIYTTPSNVASPHEDVGVNKRIWKLNPNANVLNIQIDDGKEIAMRRGAVGAGAGVAVARHFLGATVFKKIKVFSKSELIKWANESEGISAEILNDYYDSQEVMEAIGAIIARNNGYDAISYQDRTPWLSSPEFDEHVLLTPSSGSIVDDRLLAPNGNPSQVKSATGNTGAFSPDTGDIKFSIAENITEKIMDRFSSVRTFNFLNKSVNTQAYKAFKDRDFRKVFNKSVQFEKDTAKYANNHADLAPDLLPKEVYNPLKILKLTKDAEAIGKAIFDSTVESKKKSYAELKAEGYSDVQIRQYHQFFAAVNASLKDIARSEMARMAKAHKVPVNDDETLTVQELANEYAKQIKDPNVAKDFLDKANKVAKLIRESYAPLMRFGQYTVNVQEEGKTNPTFFSMFETAKEANEMAKAMEQAYPDAEVTKGIMSQDNWQLFSGVTPESMEAFAEIMGVEQDVAFQTYLRLAVSNRSAMKRLIHRKLIPGYTMDTQRVLATFLTSNARMISKNYHMGDMLKAISDIPKAKGDVRDEAIQLYSYVQNPGESGAGIRNLLFAWYLGGSVASAAVNLTQSFTTTLPGLSAISNPAQAASSLTKAMILATTPDKITGRLKAALDKADAEGVTSPHELHMLYGESIRGGLTQFAKPLRPVGQLWGALFSKAEQYNRRVAFIAAFNLAQGSWDDKFKAAEKMVEDTQFNYSKSARPNWARGTTGSMIFTFKTFMINYLEFLGKLPKREKFIALGVLILFSGMQGLGGDDLDDAIDTLGQALGYNTNAKDWKETHINNVLLHGISEFLPMDLGSRVGLQNIIPGSAIFKRSETDKTRDVLEFLGPSGSLLKNLFEAVDAATGREGIGPKAGAFTHAAMPKAFADLAKGFQMYDTGKYLDYKGHKVTEASTLEAFVKAFGFQPQKVAETRRPQRAFEQYKSLTVKTEGEIAGLMAEGLVEKDNNKINEAKSILKSWNTKNPETPIKITSAQLKQRMKAMLLSSEARSLKMAPKELRLKGFQMMRESN